MPGVPGADRPAQRICCPQKRFGMAGLMVVERMDETVDAGQGVGDGSPVTGTLYAVLIIQSPRRCSGVDHDSSGGCEEKPAASYAGKTDRAAEP
jgi:hypothetical protein